MAPLARQDVELKRFRLTEKPQDVLSEVEACRTSPRINMADSKVADESSSSLYRFILVDVA